MSMPTPSPTPTTDRVSAVEYYTPMKKRVRLAPFCRAYCRQLVCLVVFVALNAAAVWWKCVQFPCDSMVGYGLCISRGSAQVIMLNCCILLVLLSRSLLHFVKNLPWLWTVLPLECNMELHKLCGWCIFIASIVHTVAHVYDLILVYHVGLDNGAAKTSVYVKNLPGFHNTLPSLISVLGTVPIWTGVVLVLLGAVAFPPALVGCFRRRYFNAFWYTHMLFFPFLVLTCVHGAAAWFQRPQAYLWITPPLVLYFVERRLRYGKRWITPLQIQSMSHFPDAIDIVFVKPSGFTFVPGMCAYLNVPVMARHEWHPFSITSAPTDSTLSFHIQSAGDWTRALHSFLLTVKREQAAWPKVYLDGPVQCPSVEHRRFSVVVLIGAGSGIAPFVSILKAAKNQSSSGAVDAKTWHVYCVVRHASSTEWFCDTLHQLADHKHVETSVFVTESKRPDWTRIFSDLERRHRGEDVGVFFCGPSSLEQTIRLECLQREHAKFRFHSDTSS